MALFKFLALMRLEYKAALLGLAASLLSTFASVGLMAAAGWFLSAMAAAYAFDILLNLFVPSALIRLLAIMRTALRYADRLLSHQATFKIIERLRLQLFDTALKLDYLEQLKFRQADLERRLHSDIEKLELAYLKQFVPCAAAFLTGFLAAAILSAFSVKLTGIFLLGFLGAGLLAPGLAALLGSKVSLNCADEMRSLHNAAADFISGLFDLTVLGALPYKLKELDSICLRLSRGRQQLALLDGICQALLTAGAALTFAGLLLIAGELYLSGTVSAGQTMMLTIGALACFECLQSLAAALLLLPEAEGAARRVQELLAGPVRSEGTEDLKEPVQTLSLNKVSVRLPGRERPVLNNFSFCFERSLNYAVKGPSGAGKSTLLNALMGLIAPASGQVLINNQDLSTLKSTALTKALTLCFQDPALISGSVLDMFRAIRPRCTEEEVRAVLKTVELDTFVNSLPQGLDSYVGVHGSALSGGQARRLSLALALFKGGDFLLLDEPGEGLDAAQEERILRRILSLRRGVIMVTHKEAGLDGCDKILFLKE